MKIKEDRLMNAISRFRDKIEERLVDQPFSSKGEATSPLQDRPIDINPDSPFDILLEERQKEMRKELDDIKGRVNNLVFMLLGAILLNLLIRLLG